MACPESLIKDDEGDEDRETTLVLLCSHVVMQSERRAGPNSKAGLERPTSKAYWPDRRNPISIPRVRDGGAAAGSLQFGSSGTRSTTSADAGTVRP